MSHPAMYCRPDKWAIMKVLVSNGTVLYKVLAGRRGGFLDGDSWRINSGIVDIHDAGDELVFHGYSGSTYVCHKSAYGATPLSNSVFQNLRTQAEAEGVQLELLDEQVALSLEWFQQTEQPRPRCN